MPPTKRAGPPGADHGGRAREATRTLSPGIFALVMASVIVSIAMRNHHAYAISVFLMWVAGSAYTVLVVLHVWTDTGQLGMFHFGGSSTACCCCTGRR